MFEAARERSRVIKEQDIVNYMLDDEEKDYEYFQKNESVVDVMQESEEEERNSPADGYDDDDPDDLQRQYDKGRPRVLGNHRKLITD